MVYPRFNDQKYRNEYILLKDQGIREITDAYYQASTNITAEYIRSRDIDRTLAALKETTPNIAATFTVELGKINTQAVESVALPFVESGINYSEAVRNAWKELPFALASAVFLDKIPPEILKLVGSNESGHKTRLKQYCQ